MNPDAEVEAEIAAILAALRARLERLPLRSEFVESMSIEAAPAVQALHFATSVSMAADVNSLEHHETLAMVALLGRSCAVEDITPTAAHGVVPAFLGAFEDCGIAVSPSVASAVSIVFLEGFLRGRDESFAACSEARALAQVVLVRLSEAVGLVVLTGEFDGDALGERLEQLARAAFRAQLAAVVVHHEGAATVSEAQRAAAFGFVDLLASVGVRGLASGFGASADESLPCFDSLPAALEATEGSFVRAARAMAPLRALFRGLTPRRH